jgi:hypothetical protein
MSSSCLVHTKRRILYIYASCQKLGLAFLHSYFGRRCLSWGKKYWAHLLAGLLYRRSIDQRLQFCQQFRCPPFLVKSNRCRILGHPVIRVTVASRHRCWTNHTARCCHAASGSCTCINGWGSGIDRNRSGSRGGSRGHRGTCQGNESSGSTST